MAGKQDNMRNTYVSTFKRLFQFFRSLFLAQVKTLCQGCDDFIIRAALCCHAENVLVNVSIQLCGVPFELCGVSFLLNQIHFLPHGIQFLADCF